MTDIKLDVQRLREDPAREIARLSLIPSTDWADVTKGLQTQPGVYGFVLGKHRTAREAVSRAQRAYDVARTEAFVALRQEGVSIGESKERAELDDLVEERHAAYLAAEAESGMWYDLARALEMRMNALQQISSRQKEEFKRHRNT